MSKSPKRGRTSRPQSNPLENLMQNYQEIFEENLAKYAPQQALINSIAVINAWLLSILGQFESLSKAAEDEILALVGYLAELWGPETLCEISDNWPHGPLLFRMFNEISSKRENALKKKAQTLSPAIHSTIEQLFSDLQSFHVPLHLTISAAKSMRFAIPGSEEKEAAEHVFQLICGFLGPILQSGKPCGMIIHTSAINSREKVMGLRVEKKKFEGISQKEMRYAYCTDYQTGKPLECDPNIDFESYPAESLRSLQKAIQLKPILH